MKSSQLGERLKALSIAIKPEVKGAKRLYETNLTMAGNEKQLHSYINSKANTIGQIDYLSDPNGKEIRSDQEKTEVLNQYFSSVITPVDVAPSEKSEVATCSDLAPVELQITPERVEGVISNMKEQAAPALMVFYHEFSMKLGNKSASQSLPFSNVF